MASSQNSQFGQRVHGRIPVAAALRQIFSRHHAQPRRDDLHENRHQAGQRDYPEQSVFVLRPARQVGAPVARVHVSDADQNRRADECPPLLPESRLMMRHRDRAVHAFERAMAGLGFIMLDSASSDLGRGRP